MNAAIVRPVTVRDVSDEIELDPSLRPARSQSLFSILADISKDKVDVVGAERKRRNTRRVYKVGMLGNEAYYYHRKEGIAEAESYVELRRIESHWDAISAGDRLKAIDRCCLPLAAIGQALLLAAEAGDLRRCLDDFLPRKMDWSTQREAESARRRISDTLDDIRRWLSACGSSTIELPREVSREVPCWTSHELLAVLRPLYPLLQRSNNNTQLIAILYDWVRRVPNPNYVNRFSKEPLEAAEFLFDRTDSLLYAAEKWGGHECRFLARTARNELGWLRDGRFIFPALVAEDMKARLAAVACLAFLWCDDGRARLRRVALEDLEPGVRQSALWAYGFAGGLGAPELMMERAVKDSNAHVRAFAKKATALDERGWWAF